MSFQTSGACPSEKQHSVQCSPNIDYSRLINDDIFTFIIGPEKAILRVHVSVLKNISEPLGYMMTNGKMAESINKEAALPEIDTEVFTHLVKFAYQGLCAISDGVSGSLLVEAAKPTPNICFKCYHCSSLIFDAKNEPFCNTLCQCTFLARGNALLAPTPRCVVNDCPNHSLTRNSQKPFCSSHSNLDLSFIGKGMSSQPRFSFGFIPSVSENFNARQYGCSVLTHESLCQYLDAHKNDATVPWPLVQHAKVYALAKMYMIQDLPEISLHKLHRCLVDFKVSSQNIDELVDLVLFTYDNTEDVGDILSGTGEKLRDLVMAYVLVHCKVPIKFGSFSKMISAGGAHTTDFFKLICTQQSS